jgi:tetratricopeptide (TPR) repeat protein
MTSTGKLTTRLIAIVIIFAILNAVGLSPVVLIFFMGVGGVVWLVIRRAEMREVERIFEFYVAADAILREEERRWYGFEIEEVIENGESLLELMPDPPPLNYFALGALYQRLGNHDAALQYLSRLTDDQHYDETYRVAPSQQLRRYVMMLRRLEYHPATEPQTLAAIRSLERARQRNAGKMLLESRQELETSAKTAKTAENSVVQPNPDPIPASAPLSSISAPPPISMVLRDVYQEETSANH